jgi:hypothetical protein
MKKIIIVGLLATIGLESKPCKNQDVIVGRGNVYNFACSKIKYTKKQAVEINSKLFRVKTMPIQLVDKKLVVKFNHYKTLSITEELNKEQYNNISQLVGNK